METEKQVSFPIVLRLQKPPGFLSLNRQAISNNIIDAKNEKLTPVVRVRCKHGIQLASDL